MMFDKPETDQAPPVPAGPEPDADFAALMTEAATIDGPPAELGAAGEPGQVVSLPDLKAELLGALEMARLGAAEMAFPWWREFGNTWNDRRLDQIATAGAAIMQKHGWTMGGLEASWGPYLMLALATIPPAVATYQAHQVHRAELEAEARRARQAPPPAPPAPAGAAT